MLIERADTKRFLLMYVLVTGYAQNISKMYYTKNICFYSAIKSILSNSISNSKNINFVDIGNS